MRGVWMVVLACVVGAWGVGCKREGKTVQIHIPPDPEGSSVASGGQGGSGGGGGSGNGGAGD